MNAFQHLLLEQVKRYPVIRDYPIVNGSNADEKGINFAFQQIQKAIKKQLYIDISG